MTAKVEISKVCVAYGGRHARRHIALEDVSTTINEGDFVSLIGPSGCGKSTLLKAIAGLIRANSGTVSVEGTRVRGPSPSTSVVFQDPVLLPWRTCVGNVTYPLEARKLSRSEREARGRAELRRVGLEGYEDYYPGQLSGGMQQRVNLARALATKPEVLLLDEPLAALDALTRETMQQELLAIWEHSRVTTIFVTHQIDEAIFLSDRVLVMSAGPGRIKDTFEIPFQRPRDLSVKRSEEFRALEDEMWQLLESGAATSLQSTASPLDEVTI